MFNLACLHHATIKPGRYSDYEYKRGDVSLTEDWTTDIYRTYGFGVTPRQFREWANGILANRFDDYRLVGRWPNYTIERVG